MAYRGVLSEVPSFGTQLARGLGGGFGAGVSKATDIHGEIAKKLAGIKADRHEEKLKSIENGLGTIEQMRGLISSAGPSNWVQGLFGGETTKNRAELQSLGRSLIPLVAAGVPIRNQREFDEYSKVITNPNSQQAELEGALNGIEKVLTTAGEGRTKKSSKPKGSFDINNPEHKSRRDMVLKKTGGDRKKAQMILEKEFGSGE